ncbi:MAG TPA: SMP-30/gluconolactonase/LRE family protein [Pseudonocardiaceae bacterium]
MTGPQPRGPGPAGNPAGKSWTLTPCSAEPGLLTEGPRWDAARGELLWVDVLAGRLYRARLSADGQLHVLQTFQVPCHLGAAAPAVSGGYVLAAGPGFLHVDDAGMVGELAQPEAGHPDVRMNDGACDPQGRFWAGTVAYDETPGAGCLYRLELDGRCTQVLTGLTISNGIGWSPDGTTMYLADSGTGEISAFDFDPATGELGHRRTVVHITAANAVPDGLTVDHDGGIWVALWDGGALVRYHPDGSLLATVPLPVDRPTSCAFGGIGEGTLFVTTAREGLDEAALARQPDAGRLLRLDSPGATGPPCTPYRGLAAITQRD